MGLGDPIRDDVKADMEANAQDFRVRLIAEMGRSAAYASMGREKDRTISALVAALERIDNLAAGMEPDEMARPSLIRHAARAALKLARGES